MGVVAIFGALVVGLNHPAKASSTEMLTTPWQFVVNNGDSQKYVNPPANILNGKVSLTLTYDLNGTCILGGDASAIIFDQGDQWRYISLSSYGQNCFDGEQVITIPLSAFPGLNTNQNIGGSFHARFWKGTGGPYTIDITSAKLNAVDNIAPTVTAGATPTSGTAPLAVSFTATANDTDGTIASYAWNFGDTVTSTVQNPNHTYTATGTYTSTVTVTDNGGATATSSASITVSQATTNPTWVFQSVDVMKYSKDVVCNYPSDAFIASEVAKAVELGVTHVAISTPYDNPTCGSALVLTQKWVTAIRAAGLHVWHRHLPNAFEATYGVSKHRSPDGTRHLKTIADWYTANSDLVQNGDVVTPIPEPQNGGISGITYCADSLCQFSNAADFNEWLRTAQLTTKLAIKASGKTIATTLGDNNGVFVGLYGFDGYITWCDNNPDCVGQSKIEAATVTAMDNIIAIDHYPASNATMAGDLDEMRAVFPNANVVIGEFGTITQSTEATRQTAAEEAFSAFAARSWVKGVNYWHLGPGGNEGLINSDFTNKAVFGVVEGYYK